MSSASADPGSGTQLRAVTAGYPHAPVLRSLSLQLREGELHTVLGPSGSGKTTLLRVIAGLHRPTSGQVVIDGQDVTDTPAQRRGVALVPQEGALFGSMSVAANIAYGLRGVGRRHALQHPRVLELLELVGLVGLGGQLPHQLSGGQQQRVALARALAPRPRLVLLDEPFNALDAQLREQVRHDAAQALRREGSTTLLITHDRDEALDLSDRISVLRAGQIVQTDPPRALYRHPRDAWTAAILGETVLLPGKPDGARVATALGSLAVLNEAPGRPAEPPAGGSELTVLLRPEQIQLVAADGAAVTGVVRHSRFVGHAVLATVDLDGDPLSVQVRHPGAVQPGERVGLVVREPGSW